MDFSMKASAGIPNVALLGYGHLQRVMRFRYELVGDDQHAGSKGRFHAKSSITDLGWPEYSHSGIPDLDQQLEIRREDEKASGTLSTDRIFCSFCAIGESNIAKVG